MTIENYNDYIRRDVVSKYNRINVLSDGPNPEEKYMPSIKKYYNEIKKESVFKYKMGVLFVGFYMVKRFNIGEFSADEEESIIDDVIFNVKNIDELIKLCDDDIWNFSDLLTVNSIFYSLDYTDKRNYINAISDDRKKVLNIFPGFLMDIIYYLNTYDKNEILQTYLEFKQTYNDEENVRKDTVSFIAKVLMKLKDKDYYNYKFLILEMIEDLYKYIVFLIDSKTLNDDNYEYLIKLIDEDLDFFIKIASNRIDLLSLILRGFLNYILLSDDTMGKINKYFDNSSVNKKYIKILKESQKLKKINN